MGIEQNNIFYNEVYEKGGYQKEYFKQPENCVYYKLWIKVIKMLDDNDRVIDFGCGPGQFANLAIRRRVNIVKAIDFSEVAIDMAKKNNPGYEYLFQLADLYDDCLYQLLPEYDTAVFCEVLEHVEGHRKILANIQAGKKLIITLPNFDSQGHVCCFDSIDEIAEEYSDILKLPFVSTTEECYERGARIFAVKAEKR